MEDTFEQKAIHGKGKFILNKWKTEDWMRVHTHIHSYLYSHEVFENLKAKLCSEAKEMADDY